MFVDWDRCRVDDYVGITRCFRCHQYGHLAKRGCKIEEGVVICTFCAQVGHKRDECPSRARKEKPVCPACRATNVPSDHDMRSQECPGYKAAFARWIDLTQYE